VRPFKGESLLTLSHNLKRETWTLAGSCFKRPCLTIIPPIKQKSGDISSFYRRYFAICGDFPPSVLGEKLAKLERAINYSFFLFNLQNSVGDGIILALLDGAAQVADSS